MCTVELNIMVIYGPSEEEFFGYVLIKLFKLRHA
jgi:hypothetical protein